MKNIDKEGRDFIYKEEGVRLKAYLDVVGVPTIGVGFTYYPTTGKKVKLGDAITISQCDVLFKGVVMAFEQAVNAGVKVELNQHQFNALVSFAYNVGTGAFSKSTLLKKINSQSTESEIRAEFNKWNKAGGNVNKVLTARRLREAKLYFND